VAADRFGSHLIRRACEPPGWGYVAGVSGKLAPLIALQFRRLGAQRSRVPVAAVILNWLATQQDGTYADARTSDLRVPNEHMDRERSQIYRICARKERHRYAQPSIPNGGSVRIASDEG
jgi:hypothetical protein